MKKILRTIAVFILLLPGAWLVDIAGTFASKQCRFAASEALCRPLTSAVMALVGFLVFYFAVMELKKMWPEHFKSQEDEPNR